jgi:hypothetical protein
VGSVQDDKVFAVLTPLSGPPTDCVTKENGTPMIAYGIGTDLQANDLLFMPRASHSRLIRNFPDWIVSRGLADSQKIGIWWSDAAGQKAHDKAMLWPGMQRLGLDKQVVAESTTTDTAAGPGDVTAMQAFRTAGVTLVINFVGFIQMTDFMQQASAQAYHPHYVDSDATQGSADEATARYPKDEADGMFSVTANFWGMHNTPDNALRSQCLADYAAAPGSGHANPVPRSVEYDEVLMECDLANQVIAGITNAGPVVNNDTFVAGMEQINMMPGTFVPSSTYYPGHHFGADYQKTIQWQGSCSCYDSVSDFSSFWVP